MTRSERIDMRKELFSGGSLCCWCGEEMFLSFSNRTAMATLEHHFESGWVVLCHHRCNKSRLLR